MEVRNFSNEAIYANEDQIQTGNIYSSSLSIDRTNDYQNRGEISKYEKANRVTAYSVVCKATPSAPAESRNGRVDVDFVSTNNSQTDMNQTFLYSLARNDDISGFDSNLGENGAAYVNLKPLEPEKVPRPDTFASRLIYEEVFNRMPSCAEPANSEKQAASFFSPTAICQSRQHALHACADVDDIGAVSRQEDGLNKNLEELENKHVLHNNEMYELTMPQLKLG